MWTDESIFEVHHAPNRQNDRIWAKSREGVSPLETVKHPTKVMVWGGMTAQGLTELHFVPENQTANTDYYVSEILEGSLLPAVNRKTKKGTITETKLVDRRSQAILMQDNAPAHTSRRSQEWCFL